MEFAYSEANKDSRLPVFNIGDEKTIMNRLNLARSLLDQAVINYAAYLSMTQGTLSGPESIFNRDIQELYAQAIEKINSYIVKTRWENEGKNNAQAVATQIVNMYA